MARPNLVWVIDDDRSIRWVLEKALEKAGMTVKHFDSANEIAGAARSHAAGRHHHRHSHAGRPAVSTCCRSSAIRRWRFRSSSPRRTPIWKARWRPTAAAPSNICRSCSTSITPWSLVRRAVEHRRRQRPEPASIQEPTPDIIGAAPAMQEVFRAIGRLSGSNPSVLLNGESGTGKELVARALH